MQLTQGSDQADGSLEGMVTTKTLHGRHLKADESPESGKVTYAGFLFLADPGEDLFISPPVYQAVLDGAGAYTIPGVIVNNDPSLVPNPWGGYFERVEFSDGRVKARTVFIDFDGPSVIEVTDLPDAQPVTAVAMYATLDGSGNVPLSQLGNVPTSANGSYIHNQASPSASWIVTHNLGNRVGVTVYDASGDAVIGQVGFISANQISVTWPAPTTGFAVCS